MHISLFGSIGVFSYFKDAVGTYINLKDTHIRLHETYSLSIFGTSKMLGSTYMQGLVLGEYMRHWGSKPCRFLNIALNRQDGFLILQFLKLAVACEFVILCKVVTQF